MYEYSNTNTSTHRVVALRYMNTLRQARQPRVWSSVS
jgi:hypothetical protein